MTTITVSGRRKANSTSFIREVTLRTLTGEPRTLGVVFYLVNDTVNAGGKS
jgi:hypothetical protein